MEPAALTPTIAPQMAADLAAIQAADGHTVRPDNWRCAEPPYGCGQLKPSTEFSFKERNAIPRGGGKDLCHDCKRSAPLRYRQRKTRQEIQDILSQMGRKHDAEAPATLGKLALAGERAFGSLDELFAGIRFNVDNLDEAGKHTSAGNMRLGVAKLIGKAAEKIEELKPVEQMSDDELSADKQHVQQILVQNIHNYYLQQADAPELPVADATVLEHAPASDVG